MVLATSRILLAVTEFSAIWVATAIATIIMIVAIVFLLLPKASPSIIAGVMNAEAARRIVVARSDG